MKYVLSLITLVCIAPIISVSANRSESRKVTIKNLIIEKEKSHLLSIKQLNQLKNNPTIKPLLQKIENVNQEINKCLLLKKGLNPKKINAIALIDRHLQWLQSQRSQTIAEHGIYIQKINKNKKMVEAVDNAQLKVNKLKQQIIDLKKLQEAQCAHKATKKIKPEKLIFPTLPPIVEHPKKIQKSLCSQLLHLIQQLLSGN